MKRYVIRRVSDGLYWAGSLRGWAPFGPHTRGYSGAEMDTTMLGAGEEWAELDADGRPIPVDPWETWVRVVPRVDDLGVRSADAIALEAIRDYETASAAPLPAAAGLARRCRERLDRALAEADRVARGREAHEIGDVSAYEVGDGYQGRTVVEIDRERGLLVTKPGAPAAPRVTERG